MAEAASSTTGKRVEGAADFFLLSVGRPADGGDERRGGDGGGSGDGTRFTFLRSNVAVVFFFFFFAPPPPPRRRPTSEESLPLLLSLPRDVSAFSEAAGRTSSAADLEQSKAKKTNLKMLFRKSTTKWFQSA
jgi:hypothetical protein